MGSDNADHYTTDAVLTCQKIGRSEVTFCSSYILLVLTMEHALNSYSSILDARVFILDARVFILDARIHYATIFD